MDSIEYVTNEELEFVEDRSCVIEASVCCVPSIGAPCALSASIEMKSKIPHMIPGDPFIRASKQRISDLIHLSHSTLTVFGSVDLSTTFSFLDLTFFRVFSAMKGCRSAHFPYFY